MRFASLRKYCRLLLYLALVAGMLSACLQPLTATPLPTQEVVRITLPAELTPLRQAIQGCSQSQPNMALFEESSDTPADLQFVLGEPTGIESFVAQVAREQIRVILNAENPIQSLTRADLVDLYTGRKDNWQQVGGEDLQVSLWTYPAGSALRDLFDRLVLTGMRPAGKAFLAPSPDAVVEAVSQDPGAIGFLPAAGLDDRVRAVEIEPSLDQALRQPVLALSVGTPQGAARQLLSCLQSGAGRREIDSLYPLTGSEE